MMAVMSGSVVCDSAGSEALDVYWLPLSCCCWSAVLAGVSAESCCSCLSANAIPNDG